MHCMSCIALHVIAVHVIVLHGMALHWMSLYCIALHVIALHVMHCIWLSPAVNLTYSVFAQSLDHFEIDEF